MSHTIVLFFFSVLHEASVHLPRIGHSTKGFNWYGTERLIRKHLASRGIPTFMSVFHLLTLVLNSCRLWIFRSIFSPNVSASLVLLPFLALTSRYYHSRAPRGTAAPPRPSTSAALMQSLADESQDDEDAAKAPAAGIAPLPGFMGGARVFFYNLPASERKRLARYLITYPLGSQWQPVARQTPITIAKAWCRCR